MSKSSIKLRISALLGSNGFVLAESMVAVGIIGVIAMTVISQQKVSNKSVTVLASDTTINDVVRMTLGEIIDQSSCEANFKGFSKNKIYTALKNAKTSQNFLVTNNRYGVSGTVVEGNKTVVGEVQVSKIETQSIVEDNNPYAMILRITFKRKDVGGIFSSKTVTRDIPINTVMNGAVIESCFGDFNLLAQSAVKGSCIELTPPPVGSAYVSRYVNPDASAGIPYGKCVHDPGDTPLPSAPLSPCPAGTVLSKVEVASGKPTYTCSSVAGDCPTGKYVVGYNDLAGDVICDYPVPVCPNKDQVITRDSSGAYKCTKIDCSAVVPLSAFAGFNPDGSIKCNQITQSNPCSSSYATDIKPNGDVTCSPVVINAKVCPAGERINSVDALGNPVCTKYIVLPFICTAPDVVRSIDANGYAVCGPIERPISCGTTPVRSNIDCLNAGGSPENLGTTNSICYFSGSVCPGGWVACSSWTKQADVTCSDTSNTYYCNANIVNPRTASNGSMAPVNTTATGSATCYEWRGASSYGCNPVPVQTVYSSIHYVGCY